MGDIFTGHNTEELRYVCIGNVLDHTQGSIFKHDRSSR